jgi:ATP-binding cassette subfamily B protein
MVIKERKYGVVDILKIPLECSPILSILVGLQILIGGVVPTLQVIATAKFIDKAISIVETKTHMSSIFPSLFAVIALIAYTWISTAIMKFGEIRLQISIREKFRTAITEKRSKLAYKHIENSETWDLISRVSKTPEIEVKAAYTDFLSMLASIIRVFGILVLLITEVWWAALIIIIFAIPLFYLAAKSGKANYEVNREVTKYKRKYEYLSAVLTDRETVDERTLFGFGKKLNELFYKQYETARKITFKTERTWFIKMKTGSLLTSLVSILIVLVLLNPVLSGTVTIGMFISLVNAAFGLVQMMSWQLTYYMDQLAKHLEYLKDLTKFSELEEVKTIIESNSEETINFESLEFNNVSFKYPGSDNYILKGISFKLENGRHYAFVGVNGAGKSTITKLLTGLYDDFEGEIYINSKSIRTYSQRQLKAFFSVVYQDFAKYYISMRDNIKIGSINSINAEELDLQIKEAIDYIGLTKVVDKLPKGINTSLGKLKEDGQDVSGGEWQRIAMARAVINPAPLRILDEPTAALDPISESKLYEKFEQISKGKTTIFISHRLGSTKLADEIFVVGEGRVLEKGNHEELMNINGLYSEMYESQRSWYQ